VIIGAGLVGAFAAATLSKLTNVEVSIYEKSLGRREAGAALTFTESSLRTLAKVVDINDLQKILWRAPNGNGMTVRHWKTGEYLSEKKLDSTEPNFRPAKSQRIDIHNYILDHVPIEINYDHQLENIELIGDGDDGLVKVNFIGKKEPVYADLLVAADGIYSKIRRQFTKDEVVYKGAVAYRNVFDESIVSHIKNLPDEVTVWVGPTSAMFMTKLKPNKFNVAAHLPESEEVASTLRWNQTTGKGWEKQKLIDHFKDWDPLIGQILEVMPDSYAFPLEKAPWLTNLSLKDRIAFVGDAAHPTSGVYGAGAGIGFDDVWALYKSLDELSNVKRDGTYDLKKALFLFSETRTYFLQRVVEQQDLDRRVNLEYVQKADNDEEWKRRVKNTKLQAGWISRHDVDTEFTQVRDKYFLDIYNN
jgi:salicylate hydroxylase